MKGAQCAFDSAAALRRVFIKHALAAHVPGQLVLSRLLLPLVVSQQQRCAFSIQHALLRGWKSGSKQTSASGQVALPRDRAIKDPYVVLRDSETGRLSEPQRPRDILRRLDIAKESLVMIVDPDHAPKDAGEDIEEEAEHEDEDSNQPRYPICVIIDRRAEDVALKAKAKEARKRAIAEKEIELNWAIAPNDLNTRMRQLKTFLSKGYRVHVLLQKNTKRNKRTATDEEAKAVLQKVKDAAVEVPGTKETKPMDGVVGKQVKLVFQGKRPEEPNAEPSSEDA